MSRPAAIGLLLLLVAVPGCGGSRWAMRNADYREKYREPYPQSSEERAMRMAKQAVDARHVAGRTGHYFAVSAADDPLSLGGEIGGFWYPEAWLEGRAGIAGLLGTGAEDAFAGINLGVRGQAPTRCAPFVGAGTFLGYSEREATVWDWDGLSVITTNETRLFAAIYPEVGVHFWLDADWRLTGSASYYVTTAGRDFDYWFFGVSLARLADPRRDRRFVSPRFD